MDKLKTIFHDVLGIDEDRVTDELSYHECESWDSLKHLQLVAAIEREYDIDLDTEDIIAMEDVGKIKVIIVRCRDEE